MSKFDWLSLDAGLLQLLVTVLDTGSITAAAQRLGVTQSAVSHLLNKLRDITGDALFVKSGRGIVATARAEALGAEARVLLRDLERFARSGGFEPARWRTTFTIAANDFQRDLLLPPLAARLRAQAAGVVLRIVPSGVPVLDSLRADACQLIISPRPPDGTDVIQKRLFEDRYRVFFDAEFREAPKSRAEYLAAEHATVLYEPRRSLDLDQRLAAQGIERRFTVTVPGFSALPAFIRGTALIATAPGLLARRTMTGLSQSRPPVPCPNLPMYMIWHARYQQDPAHSWLREQLLSCVAPALANV
jgi:DNA-binding transcriptional LysR family regulator